MSHIDGVIITPLRRIPDERGEVMHMLRRDQPMFREFGEIYFSTVHSGKVKGWNRHKKMTLNYAVPHGLIRLVLFDDRETSTTRGTIQEILLGPDHYQLVTVPPMIWSGFMGVGSETAIVVNCATLPHDPDEIERLDTDHPGIPYNWLGRE